MDGWMDGCGRGAHDTTECATGASVPLASGGRSRAAARCAIAIARRAALEK